MGTSEQNRIFENLFVLEMANNHWGDVSRGLRIINDFSQVARFNNVRAAIKLQFRDVDSFIHPDHQPATGQDDPVPGSVGNAAPSTVVVTSQHHRYISKTQATKLTAAEFKTLVDAVKARGCIPMATPFDEKSVDFSEELGLPIIKVASSDINDWILLERIAKTRRPVIVSSGGASEKDLDDMVLFFENRNIPLAINHCVSLYPSEDGELELNQIDYLKERYRGHVIGFSTHEKTDWTNSMLISYAKGARLWERHIDIDADAIPVSSYCSLPHQVAEWFTAHKKAREMCGAAGVERRIISKKETVYLDALVRGVYAKEDIPCGTVITHDNFDRCFYLAIPLLRGQLSCRETMTGLVVSTGIKKDDPLLIDHVDSPYSKNEAMKSFIYQRGM